MVAATAVAGPALFVVGVFLIPGTSSDTPVPFDNPFGQPGLVGTVAKGMAVTGLALHAASLPAALVCVILRFRASRGVERQQLRWVATGAAIALIGLTVPLGELRGAWLDPTLLLCVPLAVAVAVLRYRLWDLDRLVSRTVTSAVVTALLVVPYLLLVPAATRLSRARAAWPWPTRPCNPPGPRCGSGPRPGRVRYRLAVDAARTATPGRRGRA